MTVDISNELNTIKSTQLGRTMRPALHDSIEKQNKELNRTSTLIDEFIKNAQQVTPQNAEIVAARIDKNSNMPVAYPTLGDRLDKMKEESENKVATLNKNLEQTNAQLSQVSKDKANNSDVVDVQNQLNTLVIEASGDSNPEVIQARGRFSVLSERLKNIENTIYPFQLNATLITTNQVNNARSQLLKSVKYIELYNADPSKEYYISQIVKYKNNGEWYDTFISIKCDGIEVCKYTLLDVRPSGTEVVHFKEKNNSGVTGKAKIDWDSLTDSTSYNLDSYVIAGLDRSTIKQFDISLLPENSVSEEKLTLELSNKINGMAGIGSVPKIFLPEKVYACVGHELSIYFASIIECDNLDNYEVRTFFTGVSDSNAGQYNNFFRITPKTEGQGIFTVKIYRNYEEIISDSCVIKIVSDSEITEKITGLFIGDSITEQGFYLKELETMVPSFTSVGTRSTDLIEIIKHEGRSGWRITDYFTPSYANKSNAFYNPTSQTFDFSYYMAQNPTVGVPNFVAIGLGTNDVNVTSVPLLLQRFNEMIKSIRTYDPNMKIIIAIPPVPCKDNGGWVKNNGLMPSWVFKKTLNTFIEALLNEYDGRESELIFINPTYINIDEVYDFPYEEVQTSSRQPVMIKRGTDNVHPNKFGMYKISDLYYNWIKAIF